VTVGNEYSAMTKNARILAMGASMSGVLLLAVYVAGALTRDRATVDRQQLADEIAGIMLKELAAQGGTHPQATGERALKQSKRKVD
ncbi:MAG TPA: hypothetical protein VID29_03775, partial [Solirubrobacteraceae bacterium]